MRQSAIRKGQSHPPLRQIRSDTSNLVSAVREGVVLTSHVVEMLL